MDITDFLEYKAPASITTIMSKPPACIRGPDCVSTIRLTDGNIMRISQRHWARLLKG